MSRYPSIPEEVALVPVPGEGCYALRGDAGYFLPDTGFDHLLPLVDGTRSYRDLRGQCSSQTEGRLLSSLLRQLVRRRILEEWEHPLPAPPTELERIEVLRQCLREDIYREYFPGGIHDLRGEYETTTPHLLIPLYEDREGPALFLVDDLTDPRIAFLARSQEERQASWILFQPDGWCPVIGPCFSPTSAPWSDLVRARKGVAETLFLLRRKTGRLFFPPVRRREDPALRLTLLQKLLDYCREINSPRRVLSFRTLAPPDYQIRFHHFPSLPLPSEPLLQPDYARTVEYPCPVPNLSPWNEGRELPITAVASRLSVLCDPYLGPIERLEVLPLDEKLCEGHATALAWHRQRDLDSDWETLHDERLFPSGGNGPSSAHAQGAALAEAVERLSTHLRGEEPLIHARIDDLPGRALTPPQLEHFSAAQQVAPQSRACGVGWNAISPVWSGGQSIPWIATWSLTHRERVFVPAAYAYYGWPEEEKPAALCTSNGVASGSSESEALLHGLFELVERDAVALWWYQQARRPSAQALPAPVRTSLDHARQILASRNRNLEVLDLTHDLGIPVIAAASSVNGKAPWLFGFGCHLLPEKAVGKAIGEVLYQAVVPDRLHQYPLNRHLADQPDISPPEYLLPHPHAQPCSPANDYPPPDQSWNLLINWLTRHFAQHGMEILALRLSRPDYQWPVVRVIIPSLHHFWPRYGSSRLYTFPPEWQLTQLPVANENELNPFPLTL